MSLLEIYNEQLIDLLSDTPDSKKCTVQSNGAHSSKGRNVSHLTEVDVTSESDVMDVLRRGDENRAVAATKVSIACVSAFLFALSSLLISSCVMSYVCVCGGHHV